MTTLVQSPSRGHARVGPVRFGTARRYLMCPPTYFDVTYSINPWMDPSVPVDRQLALCQWERLVETYRAYGHRVELLTPQPGLPDMVFAANGATVVDGRVLLARFANPQRSLEAEVHARWYRHRADVRVVRSAGAVNEGEGDFVILSHRVLAGHGFRTTRPAARELATLTGREVISLDLVDPRFYHLDVALAVLDADADHIAYYPAAFSPLSQHLLRRLFPDAVVAGTADALAFGLNCVSDGRHVFVPAGADQFMGALTGAGYDPVAIDLSELAKGGGSVKCCTQEFRASHPVRSRLSPAGS